MKTVYKAIIFTFLITNSSLFAQDNDYIDSLKTELITETVDTQKIKILLNLSQRLWNSDIANAEKYAKQSLAISKKLNYLKGNFQSEYTLAVIKRKDGSSDESVIHGKNALDLAYQRNNNHSIALACNSLGGVYLNLGSYDSSSFYFHKALSAYEEAGLISKMANAENNLGNVFYRQKKKELAKEYFEKALKTYRADKKEGKVAIVLMNLGKVEKNDSLAFAYFNESLKIHEKKNNLNGIASVNINMGSKMMKDSLFEAAIPYYSKALEITEKINHKTKLSIANSSLGKIYFHLEQEEKAIAYYTRSLELAIESNFLDEQRDVYNQLSIVHAEQKNYEQAHQYLKISRDLGDSLINSENIKITSELEAKFDNKQKEAKLASQQLTIERQKNFRNTLIIGITILLMGVIALFQWFYYRNKRKAREATLEIEKQKAATENLRQVDEIKSRFFANISHELKTPLSMVITPIEEVLTKSSDDNLLLAHHNSKKVFRLIKEILDLSKLEAGQLELKLTNVSLHQLVHRIFYSFESLAQRRKVQLDFNFDLPKYLRVEVDVEKFEKILDNLISNAVKFSKPNGIVSLNVFSQKTAQGEQFNFNVSDNGSGIGVADLERIFDRYYQGANGKKRGGTGIGLALSKELAQLFGGDLSAESAVEKGSTFSLSIPLEKADPSVIPTEIYEVLEKPMPNPASNGTDNILYQPILLNGNKPNILIVEDNFEMSDFLTRMLSPNYNCHIAYNGLEALQKLARESYDLITSDVMMPEMDGFELRKMMNENVQWRQTPFIMLTASDIEQDRLKGFNLGVDDYITKPFSSKELLARVDNLLKNKSERDKFNEKDTDSEKPETADHQLLKHAEQIILDNIHNLSFKVPDLAKEIGYSQRQLTRIIKKLTGLSPVNFILEIRLQKAYQLFQNRQFSTVSEVRYEVGMESAAYFTTKFKERFGKNPKEYLA